MLPWQMCLLTDRISGYTGCMTTRVLVCDKVFPAAVLLTSELRRLDIPVALASSVSANAESAEGFAEVRWDRLSSLSARTAVREAQNALGSIDQAVFFFDGPLLQAQYPAGKEDPQSVIDSWVSGYMSMVRHCLTAFDGSGRLVFVHSPFPDSTRGLHPVREGASPSPFPGMTSVALSLAESAFIRLAEETAAFLAIKEGRAARSLLVSVSEDNSPEALAALASRIAEPYEGKRNPVRWIKPLNRPLFQLKS